MTERMRKIGKPIFYILSLTWGLPLTIAGAITALVLRIKGYRPQKWGYCRYFEFGERWGGLNLGLYFFKDKTKSIHTMDHELGHGIQNCFFGFLTPFIVVIPSTYRYWVRRLAANNPEKLAALPAYESAWFEAQATKLGKLLMGHSGKKDPEK